MTSGPTRAGDYRVLVTGSREWPPLLEHMVFDALRAHLLKLPPGRRMIVVHGRNRRGVDAMASAWVRANKAPGWPVEEEPHRARWELYGKGAGFVRNAEMVAAGADVCLAFILNASAGSADCANRAKAAGIPVEPHELWSDQL